MALWAKSRDTVSGSTPSYLDRLRTAAERAGLSLRAVGRLLAARRNISPENARRMLYEYAEKDPSPDVAADLAVIVGDQSLAAVRPLADRRRDRLQSIEDDIERILEFQSTGAAVLAEILRRLDDLGESGRGHRGQSGQ